MLVNIKKPMSEAEIRALLIKRYQEDTDWCERQILENNYQYRYILDNYLIMMYRDDKQALELVERDVRWTINQQLQTIIERQVDDLIEEGIGQTLYPTAIKGLLQGYIDDGEGE